ncbi:MAG: cupin domain-containing protein [Maricaulaceae bacterium]|nr:cupin domain-containing protein [Maricaulaceae bacterium]
MTGLSAQDVVRLLDLAPHPEGGWFRETFRDEPGPDGRARSTAIHYLLAAGQVSHWHRVTDAAEVWHWHAGAALDLSLSPDGAGAERLVLGPDLAAGQRPQAVIPKGVWQSARSRGAWTLCGCTVAPGFEFSGFEMAPRDWSPASQ